MIAVFGQHARAVLLEQLRLVRVPADGRDAGQLAAGLVTHVGRPALDPARDLRAFTFAHALRRQVPVLHVEFAARRRVHHVHQFADRVQIIFGIRAEPEAQLETACTILRGCNPLFDQFALQLRHSQLTDAFLQRSLGPDALRERLACGHGRVTLADEQPPVEFFGRVCDLSQQRAPEPAAAMLSEHFNVTKHQVTIGLQVRKTAAPAGDDLLAVVTPHDPVAKLHEGRNVLPAGNVFVERVRRVFRRALHAHDVVEPVERRVLLLTGLANINRL